MVTLPRTRTPMFLAGAFDDEPTRPIPHQTMFELATNGPASDGVPTPIEGDARTEPVLR